MLGGDAVGKTLSSDRKLPPEIGQLTNLTLLDLTSNHLTALPPEIGNLTKLRDLNLGDNKLTALPHEFSNLTNLEYPNISGNKLPVEEVERLKPALPQCDIQHD